MSVIYTPFDKSFFRFRLILAIIRVPSKYYAVFMSAQLLITLRYHSWWDSWSKRDILRRIFVKASTLKLKNNYAQITWSAIKYLYNFSSCCRSYQRVVDKNVLSSLPNLFLAWGGRKWGMLWWCWFKGGHLSYFDRPSLWKNLEPFMA